jgi:hypothetical protein
MDVAHVVELLATFASRERNLAEGRVVPPLFGALLADSLGIGKFETWDELALAARLAFVVECTIRVSKVMLGTSD